MLSQRLKWPRDLSLERKKTLEHRVHACHREALGLYGVGGPWREERSSSRDRARLLVYSNEMECERQRVVSAQRDELTCHHLPCSQPAYLLSAHPLNATYFSAQHCAQNAGIEANDDKSDKYQDRKSSQGGEERGLKRAH